MFQLVGGREYGIVLSRGHSEVDGGPCGEVRQIQRGEVVDGLQGDRKDFEFEGSLQRRKGCEMVSKVKGVRMESRTRKKIVENVISAFKPVKISNLSAGMCDTSMAFCQDTSKSTTNLSSCTTSSCTVSPTLSLKEVRTCRMNQRMLFLQD